jgi:hypothetical protein
VSRTEESRFEAISHERGARASIDLATPLYCLDKRGRVSSSPMVEIQGRQLKLSNLDKILYPATGFTKGQVVDYYAHVAPVLVPHLAGRPLTLKRYPNGVDSEFFF